MKAQKNNNLCSAYRKLWAVYEPLHIKRKERIWANMNKVHHTPSLDYWWTGLRNQDTIKWDPACADKTACPVCG